MPDNRDIPIPEQSTDPSHIGKHVIETVLMGLLISLTAGLFGKSAAISATRWGWLGSALYWTYALASTRTGKRLALRFRALYEGKPLMSYGLVVFSSAVLGMFYWWGINQIYDKAFPPAVAVAPNMPPPSATANPATTTASPTQPVTTHVATHHCDGDHLPDCTTEELIHWGAPILQSLQELWVQSHTDIANQPQTLGGHERSPIDITRAGNFRSYSTYNSRWRNDVIKFRMELIRRMGAGAHVTWNDRMYDDDRNTMFVDYMGIKEELEGITQQLWHREKRK